MAKIVIDDKIIKDKIEILKAKQGKSGSSIYFYIQRDIDILESILNQSELLKDYLKERSI